MNHSHSIVLLIFFFIFQGTTWAQEEALEGQTQIEVSEKESEREEADKDKPLQSPTSQGVEKIEVTGSYIRRIDVEGPSPVVTFTQEDFEKTGVSTVSDYLRESPLFGNSSTTGNRDGYFRFRGQSAGATLVLINGMRVPQLGGPGRGFYAGVENIPTNVIERVEILKDGSSALYGSDAMAGVMNFITKKDYDGAEFSTQVTVPEAGFGLQQEHTVAYGQNYSRGSWFATAQFVEQRGYTSKDSGDYYQPALANQAIVSARSNGGIQYKSADGKNQTYNVGCPDPTQDCIVDTRAYNYAQDDRKNIGTLLSGQFDITPDVNIQVVGMYNRRQRTDRGTPYGIRTSDINVSDIGSSSLQQLVNNGDTFKVDDYVPLDEVGPRRVNVLQNAYSAQSKVQGYYLDTWTWNLSGSYAYTLEEHDHINGLYRVDGFEQAIQQGFNPLSASSADRSTFDAIGVRGTEAYQSSQTTARLVTSGELFDLNNVYGTGGPFSMAIGTEAQWESTSDLHDQVLIINDLNQNFEPNISGSRQVTSVFTEFVLYPLNSVEMQLAGRYDEYSDFGGTFNPKLSIGYRPSNKILLRSSIGTNFNAPAVRDVIARDQTRSESLRFCDNCDANRVPTVRYADDLNPETGVNYNFGTVIQPNKLWTFTIDQWNFEGRDSFSAVSASNFNNIYQNIDPANREQYMKDLGVEIERDANGNVTSARLPLVSNLGARIIRGLDIETKFASPVRLFGRVVNFGVSFDHTHMISYKTQDAPQLAIRNRRDLEWKNTLAFNLATERHSYRLAARTLAGDTEQSNNGQNFLTRTHTEYDLNYVYNLPFWDAKFNLGVKNVLNSPPPVVMSNALVDFNDGFNSYAFQALGRRYYVGYSMTF